MLFDELPKKVQHSVRLHIAIKHCAVFLYSVISDISEIIQLQRELPRQEQLPLRHLRLE